MSNLKIAKQLPFNVLVKRLLKRILPAQKIDYTLQDERRAASNYTINSLLKVAELKAPINQEVIQHYVKHEFDLLEVDG